MKYKQIREKNVTFTTFFTTLLQQILRVCLDIANYFAKTEKTVDKDKS